ncbi:hypothetical protein [Roseimaritima sediminicola]|uniref:hypothetical protein n=1 Tax=Roseimaritima sediminicola TaxID=2662066 RepID=UPI00129837C5|nr:hypothetical protein [Roseimaritima sediminicola]
MNSEHPRADDCGRHAHCTTNTHPRQQSLFVGGEPAVASETRRDAYQAAQPKLTGRLATALDSLRAAGPRGRTRHELAEAMELPLQSVCSLALRLRREGLARESGKRSTPSGSMAAVLVACDDGEAADE